MSEILRVQNLKKYFKTSRGMLHAVDDVTFTIEKGKTGAKRWGLWGSRAAASPPWAGPSSGSSLPPQGPWSLTASAHRTAVCPALSGRSTGAICR